MLIDELMLQTSNIAATTAFYNGILGLPIAKNNSDSISFQVGASVLTFSLVNNTDATYHFAFNIPENQLKDAIKWTKGKVVLLPVTPGNNIADFPDWKANAVYFYDNNGNLLEMIARTPLDNYTGTPFSAQSLLNISEIGIVLDNIPDTATRLINGSGIPVFERQPRADDFTVLGNDNGLLILVNPGRNWFPTQNPAKAYLVMVQIRGDRGPQHITFAPPKSTP